MDELIRTYRDAEMEEVEHHILREYGNDILMKAIASYFISVQTNTQIDLKNPLLKDALKSGVEISDLGSFISIIAYIVQMKAWKESKLYYRFDKDTIQNLLNINWTENIPQKALEPLLGKTLYLDFSLCKALTDNIKMDGCLLTFDAKKILMQTYYQNKKRTARWCILPEEEILHIQNILFCAYDNPKRVFSDQKTAFIIQMLLYLCSANHAFVQDSANKMLYKKAVVGQKRWAKYQPSVFQAKASKPFLSTIPISSRKYCPLSKKNPIQKADFRYPFKAVQPELPILIYFIRNHSIHPLSPHWEWKSIEKRLYLF